MPRRSTANEDLCDSFRRLLTDGFHVDGIDRDEALKATKPWRGELWKAFREIEDRMCPVRTHERNSQHD